MAWLVNTRTGRRTRSYMCGSRYLGLENRWLLTAAPNTTQRMNAARPCFRDVQLMETCYTKERSRSERADSNKRKGCLVQRNAGQCVLELTGLSPWKTGIDMGF
jgi:hypothetical protein